MTDTFNLPMFDGSESQEDFWLRQHGKRVLVNGISYTLKVSAYNAIYPYKHRVLNRTAEPVNKYSKFYLAAKERAGGDWITDLDDDFDFEMDVLTQIALLEVA